MDKKVWKDFYEEGDLGMVVHLTNSCNAACPQCDRTEIIDKLGNYEVDLERIKRWFPPETLQKIRYIDFTGPFGDAAASPHLLDILQYIVEVSDTPIHFNTNGSLKTEEWWWNLGVICGEQLTVTFDVDGINQEMHETYRRNTNLQKVLNNMKTLSQTPAQIFAFTVLFRHNQDYLKEIEQLCYENGAERFEYAESNRFRYSDTESFYDSNGKEYTLERVIATDNNRMNSYPDKTYHRADYDKRTKIACYWHRVKNLNISYDGKVFPCCHWGYHAYQYTDYSKTVLEEAPEEYKWMFSNEASLDYNSLEEIVNHKFYTDILYDDMQDINTAKSQCKRHCSY